ncbi:taurine ABC transporter substrate-binding protein [Mariniplasma anaerobium]|uniref:Taurine ABC transporter substrate-binding protein n=1 Tax=Mariniplasma anaerobium TaxID=2735436 RepID=A0A7U9XV39_9MOLU|nr:ABC transporter substrate-binding protein [Mariniplasma anaerobium]BCR35752.1 taurine ABC transporter substrate-binding protein [Mariniplasma anaerobium]
MKKMFMIGLLFLLVILTSCGGSKTEVNIGLLKVPNDAILAKQMGLFEEKYNALGYDVNYYTFDSGVDANKAIVSGDIDFATMGNINSLVALGSNLDAELIWIHETLGDVEALVVKNDSGITEVEDLVGKNVATTFVSTAHYVLLNVLKEAGIEDEVQLLNMKTSELAAAWLRGDIDAAYTWQPTLGTLIDNDGFVLVSSEDMIEKGYMTANVELVRKSFAEANPELVEAYIQCMDEAYKYFLSNRADALSMLASELDLTVDEIDVQVSGSIWTSLAEMNDNEFITGYVDTMFSQSEFLLDQDFVNRVITRAEVEAFINNSYAIGVNNGNFIKN